MATSTSLVPTQQEEISFYEDRIVALLVSSPRPGLSGVWVPIRPICDQLSLSWSGQRERIRRDPVLSEAIQGVRVTRSPGEGGEQEMLCLPLEYLNGWLFGVSALRVKSDGLREKLIRYQRECYLVLWDTFRTRTLASLGAEISAEQLVANFDHLKLGIDGILDYLWRSQQHDAVVRGLLQKVQLDVHEVGGTIEPGTELTDRQRRTIYELALEVTALMAQSGEQHNPYAIIFGALKKSYGVTTYRVLPRGKYRQAHDFLSGWKAQLQQQIRKAGDEPCIL